MSECVCNSCIRTKLFLNVKDAQFCTYRCGGLIYFQQTHCQPCLCMPVLALLAKLRMRTFVVVDHMCDAWQPRLMFQDFRSGFPDFFFLSDCIFRSLPFLFQLSHLLSPSQCLNHRMYICIMYIHIFFLFLVFLVFLEAHGYSRAIKDHGPPPVTSRRELMLWLCTAPWRNESVQNQSQNMKNWKTMYIYIYRINMNKLFIRITGVKSLIFDVRQCC